MSTKIEQTRIADIQLEPNKKLGYYLVDNVIYYNKFQAMIEATKTNSQVRWFYNEDVLVKYPWHVEPTETIEEIYRQRAQQIRDQYDYIRVEASGGSDSNTVIYSFLLNGIHLDEVVYRYPKIAERHFSTTIYDQRPENNLSEWELAAQPLLKWIATHSPNTKITIVDYSESVAGDNFSKNESWVFETKNFVSPSYCMGKFDNTTQDFLHTVDRGGKMCIIYGAEKPKVFIKDDKFFIYFIDNLTGHVTPSVGDYTNIVNEMFFWTPDMPKLMCKQAHMVKNWMEQPANSKFAEAIKWPTHTSLKTRTLYEQIVRSIVYPNYDINTFQTGKPLINISNEMDDWFFNNYKDSAVYSVWRSGIKYLEDNIDQSYFVNHPSWGKIDFKFFESPYYCFGDCRIKNPTPVLNTKKLVENIVVKPGAVHRHIIDGKLVIY
jgi:hypothetical protein